MNVSRADAEADGSTLSNFESLFRLHYDAQVKRAFLMTGSHEAAHDVVSKAMTTVYQRMAELDEPVLYMSRCVMNGCRDWGRRHVRWSKLVRPGPFVEPAQVDGALDRVELADALAALPHRQRAAIVLRYYGRESESRIAQVLGCRPGTVGSLIHRGLAALRKDLT